MHATAITGIATEAFRYGTPVLLTRLFQVTCTRARKWEVSWFEMRQYQSCGDESKCSGISMVILIQ